MTSHHLLIMMHIPYHEGNQAEGQVQRTHCDIGESDLIMKEKMFPLWRFRNFENLTVGEYTTSYKLLIESPLFPT